MKTREQEYAKAVHDQVYAIYGQGSIYEKQYGSLAHKLPILIRTAGLAQALAFADTRKPAAQQKLLSHLDEVVLGAGTSQTLAEISRNLPLLDYMRLTNDVLLALTWFKRFAQSILGVDAGDEPEEGGERDG